MLIQKIVTTAPTIASTITITLPSWAGGMVGVVVVVLLIASLILVFKKEYWGALLMIAIMMIIIIGWKDATTGGPLSNAFSNKGVEIINQAW